MYNEAIPDKPELESLSSQQWGYAFLSGAFWNPWSLAFIPRAGYNVTFSTLAPPRDTVDSHVRSAYPLVSENMTLGTPGAV